MRPLLALLVLLCASVCEMRAAFHVMQIDEVIGGLNGNPNAQAIELRMRSGGQTVLAAASLWAWDATGNNRVLLLDIAGNVSNGATGARILLATAAFTSAMVAGGAAGFTPDFTLAAAIPAAYLAAGRITYEDDGGNTAAPGTIYWSLAWGGAGYTGNNANTDPINGATGGTPFASALPTGPFRGIQFTGSATAASTNNSTDYALTPNPAVVTKNNGTAFSVVPEPGSGATLAVGALALAGFATARRRAFRSAG